MDCDECPVERVADATRWCTAAGWAVCDACADEHAKDNAAEGEGPCECADRDRAAEALETVIREIDEDSCGRHGFRPRRRTVQS